MTKHSRVSRATLVFSLAAAGVALADTKPPEFDVAFMSGPARIADGTWQYILYRSRKPLRCAPDSDRYCTGNIVSIVNSSTKPLVCAVEGGQESSSDRSLPPSNGTKLGLIEAGTQKAVLRVLSVDPLRFAVAAASCEVRRSAPVPTRKPGCTFEVVRPGDLAAYYPPTSKLRGDEGSARVDFTLQGAKGRASELVVADSSFDAALDAAALRYVGEQDFSTVCPGARFSLMVRFSIER